MVRSGICWDEGCFGGLGFWGANGHDGVWHIALSESLSRGGFEMPVFSGASIQNYHIGFDLILAGLHKITSVPIVNLYFQVLPIAFSLSIGFLVYKFVESWQKSKTAAWWATFFVYFGGGWGYLVSLIRGQGWGGESMFWSMQSISTLINPPFALSLITILLGLIYLKKYLDQKTTLGFILAAFFLSVSIFIKVYAGLLVLASLFTVSFWQIIRKKDFSILLFSSATLLLSLLFFIPLNKSSAGLVSFSPFWFLESMMALPDRFYWPKLYSAMTTYRMGQFWLKAVAAYGLAFTIFILGNLGTRVIALTLLCKKPKRLLSGGPIEVFIFTMILAGITVPMLFVQDGVSWNTIQFFYYSLIFLGISAGIVMAKFTTAFKKTRGVSSRDELSADMSSFLTGNPVREKGENVIGKSRLNALMIRVIKVAVIILTIPTTIASLGNYLTPKPQSALPASEVEALRFLSKEPSGIVLTYPYIDTNLNNLTTPIPLYQYTSTAYVSAFSGKPVYLEDQVNLGIMQYPWQERRLEVENFIATTDAVSAKQFLHENNIEYIYWLKGQEAKIGYLQLGLTSIFDNNNVTIFKVN